MNLTALSERVQRMQGARTEAQDTLTRLEGEAEENALSITDHEEARAILQAVAQETQKGLEYRLGELVTLALAAVFPEPYSLRIVFEPKRGRTEVVMRLLDADGNEFHPVDAVGGGVADIAAFALRICIWSLYRPRPRAVMVLDEPFRFLSVDLQERATAMLQELSEKLGMQFIIITHEEVLEAENANVIRVKRVRGRSEVEAAAIDGLRESVEKKT